jgi:hypothetical protein
MTIKRGAGPQGTLEIDFYGGENTLDLSRALLDGKQFAMASRDKHAVRVRADDQETPPAKFTANAALTIVRGLRDGRVLSFGPPHSESTQSVPLNGLAAVLLMMDDVQEESARKPPFSRFGSMSVSAVPVAPTPPYRPDPAAFQGKLTPAGNRALVAAVHANAALMKAADCEDPDKNSQDSADQLTADTVLVLVECSRGSYQSLSDAFIAPLAHPGKAQRVSLPVPFEKKPIDSLFEANYQPATRILSMSAKGRGPADCGTAANWIFDGKQFQLVAYSGQRRCGGPGGVWPILWQLVGFQRPS